MPLKEKYLKYSPEITLEIFTLIWNKLIECGYSGATDMKGIYNNSSKSWPYIVLDDKMIITRRTSDLQETTVQEILGYDPFEKEFILPEKWVINARVKDVDLSLLNNYFNKLSNSNYFTGNYSYYHFPDVTGKKVDTDPVKHTYRKIMDGYTEITFEQFQKYVLKNTEQQPKAMESKVESKEVIPEYVECISDTWSNNNSNLGKIFKVEIGKDGGRYIAGYCIEGSISWTKNFKPSTKEAFEAQNKPKSIKKWSVGSFVVFLKKYGGHPKGTVDIITFLMSNTVNVSLKYFLTSNNCCLIKDLECKWFATKSEAERFAKNLQVEAFDSDEKPLTGFPTEGCCKFDKRIEDLLKKDHSIYESSKMKTADRNIICWNIEKYWYVIDSSSKREYNISDLEVWLPKKTLKQAVHCTSQEEWDFVTEKLGYKWAQHCSFTAFGKSTCISLIDTQYSYVDYLKNDYQILSFQEWCDLNGYKMEKECKFEVGKYYRFNISEDKSSPTRTIRFTGINKDGNIVCDLWLMNSEVRFNIGGNSWRKINVNNPIELSIEEIQQYLPDGHLDKIKSNQEFKVGDWIYCEKSDKSDYRLNFKGGEAYIPIFKLAEFNMDKSFLRPVIGQSNGVASALCRHATPEEINQHLEVVNKKTMKNVNEVEAGKYFVTLEVSKGDYNCAKTNYCFKQRITNTYSQPACDLSGSSTNGHHLMSFNNKEELKSWRYATSEEISEYERLNRPFDVTTLESKEISLKTLIDKGNIESYFKNQQTIIEVLESKTTDNLCGNDDLLCEKRNCQGVSCYNCPLGDIETSFKTLCNLLPTYVSSVSVNSSNEGRCLRVGTDMSKVLNIHEAMGSKITAKTEAPLSIYFPKVVELNN